MSPHAVVRPSTMDDLRELIGVDLGPTAWHLITQERIDEFAALTGDRQWIHVDPRRAGSGVFGGTIAHGLYSLSRGPAFMEELMAFDGFAHGLNYGYEKVRFPSPLPVDSRIRMRATVVEVEEREDGSAHVVAIHSYEREGSDKPVCVAHAVSRFYLRPVGEA